MKRNKEKIVSGFVIGTFVALYLMVSIISTIHVVSFFELSNAKWLAVSLAIAFEVGAAASLASIVAMEKMNKGLVWLLFIVLTGMQAMGNTYYAFVNLADFGGWIELFGLVDEDIIYQKRILSLVSGAILPLVALGFIKSLVDYIKPSEVPIDQPPKYTDSEKREMPFMKDSIESSTEVATSDDVKKDMISYEIPIEKVDDISEPLRYELDRSEMLSDIEKEYEFNGETPNIGNAEILGDFANVNSNKSREIPRSHDLPTNPDLDPTKLI